MVATDDDHRAQDAQQRGKRDEEFRPEDEQEDEGEAADDEQPPESLRIACLIPSATDLCVALGLAGCVVGVTHECDSHHLGKTVRVLTRDRLHHPSRPGLSQREIHSLVQESSMQQQQQLKQPPHAEAGATNPTEEAACLILGDDDTIPSLYPIVMPTLQEANPTLILTQDLCEACAPSSSSVRRALERIGLGMTDAAVEVVSLTPRTLREVVEDNVRRVARACGVPRRGTRLQKTLWNRLVQIKEAVERRRRLDGWGADDPIFSLPKPPTVLLLEWLDPPFDGGHWIPDMIGAAGANCANARWRDEGPRRSSVKSHEISWDDVERSDPDTLVVACCGFDTQRNASDALREWRRWGRLRCAATAEAAASREVYEECEMSVGGVWAVDGDRYFARPGPMLVHGVALLALCAHSRRHPDLLHDLLELDWVDREWIEKGCRRIDAEAPVHPGETAADPAAENDMEDFVSIHDRACAKQETFYVDPASRYRVFTEYAHLQRGKCCGSGCRHCPYGHENVKDDDSKAARIQQPAVLAKGEAPSLPEHSLHPSEHDQSKVLFWSGGKDSFLAVRALARQAQEQAAQFSTSGPPSDGQKCRGFGVILLTTFDATSGTVAHQEMPVTTIVRQARHLGLMLVGVPMHRRSSEPYVNRIRRALDLIERKLGIRVSSLVFGDLHLAHVVEWRKEHLSKLGLYRLEFPLYRRSYDELLCDLKASGVTCVVTASTIDAVLAGELYDADLMRQRLVLGAASSASIASGEVYDVMGENGEFHTEAQVWTVDRDRAFGFLTA